MLFLSSLVVSVAKQNEMGTLVVKHKLILQVQVIMIFVRTRERDDDFERATYTTKTE
jgi:hypothetical protein